MSFAIFPVAGSSKDESVSNMQTGKDKHLPSFWIPSLTPDAAPKLEEKPVSSCYTLEVVRARGYKTFFMLNSVEHEIFPANKY